ncbi:MAG: M43 family zinc metalloprotease [Bacteroidia bacterium]|nr:M43 family zinc metalloprotease [Bacteroidia bacterium]
MRYILPLLTVVWAQVLVCGTDLYNADLVKSNPEYAQNQKSIDELLSTWAQLHIRSIQRTGNDCPESEYVIPVVVHIIHSGAGQPDSLPAERVFNQMRQLFDDFRKRPYSKGYSSGVDTRIEFSLATKDPSGNPHPGITYTHYTAAGLSSATIILSGSGANASTLKSNVGWDRNKYLNIWVVRRICSAASGCPASGDILGFATLPAMGTSTDQGVMVASDYFGLTTRGQTTTHEIGHYLNLYHTFQGNFASSGVCEGVNSSNCASGGDRVCDTPPTKQDNYGNARRQNTCADNLSAWGNVDKPDMVRNYMDYLDDPSLDIFTEGQAERMRSTLSSPSISNRKQWTSTNLQATGTGEWGRLHPNFALQGCEQPPCVVCPNQALYFTSYSMGKPSTFTWEIRKGNTVVGSSTDGPCATIPAPATPDTYSVRLVIQNQTPTPAETTYTNFLIVRNLSNTASYPFVQDFESSVFPPQGWIVVNPDFATRNSNNITWQRYSGSGRGSYGGSNACVRVRNWSYFNYGQSDYLITPLISIPTSAVNPTLAFDVYYRAVRWGNASNVSMLYGDTLAVYISNDCGSTWQLLYEEGGEALDVTGQAITSTGTYPSELTPPQGPNGDWRRKRIPIPDSYKGQNVLIRFENRTMMGNTLYLDSVQVANDQSITTGVASLTSKPIRFFPNPVEEGKGTLVVANSDTRNYSYRILTPVGHVVKTEGLPAGQDSYTVSFSGLPAGVYLLEVYRDGELHLTERVLLIE